MAKPILIGDLYFPTLKAAKDEIRSRINKYDFGSTVNDDDTIFFAELFKHHDEYEEKVGVGIDHITVEKDFHKHRNLYIHRKDGTKIDISWVHCVQTISKKVISLLAFRRAIKGHVIDFRNQLLDEGSTCPVLNIPLTADNCHVAYPRVGFNDLVDHFLKTKKMELDSIKLKNPIPSDEDQRAIIKEKEIEFEWQSYHKSNAKMELYSKKANQSRTS